MAIVVMEEILGGLDEVKEALDRAIKVLTDLIEECDRRDRRLVSSLLPLAWRWCRGILC